MGLFFRCGGMGGCRTAWNGAALAAVLAVVGCASPGPPRAPSLNLPAPVTNLVASRSGDEVTLRFTAPSRTTDKLAVRGGRVTGELCRQVEGQACVAVSSSEATVATTDASGARNAVTWTDRLPADLAGGGPRLLGYRVEFFSASGRSAGWSAAAYTAAGAAPAKVEDLRVEGSRMGPVVAWRASQEPGEVLIERRDLAAKEGRAKVHGGTAPKVPGERVGLEGAGSSRRGGAPVVWMGTRQSEAQGRPDRVLDTTATPETPYAYSALRRVTVTLGGSQIEVRSAPTAAVAFTLREIYPPAVPTGLTAAGYFEAASATEGVPGKFAVDLIWNPVDEAGVIVPLAGYDVYRQAADMRGRGEKLNAAPVAVPSFHDATAKSGTAYRYSVTAVDAKGNESAAATVAVGPGS